MLRITSALAAALFVLAFTLPSTAQSLSELVSRAKAARNSGNCELAIRLYRKIRRQVADPGIKATVGKRIGECRALLYKKYSSLVARQSCDKALTTLERALEYAPNKSARQSLLQRRNRCQREQLETAVSTAVKSGDCDRLTQSLAALRVKFPASPLLQPLRSQQLEQQTLRTASRNKHLASVGRCHELQNRFGEAVKAYRAYLKAHPMASDAVTIRARIDKLRPLTKQMTRRLVITSTPSGARVLIGGRSGVTPFELRLPLGRYTVALQLDGYRSDVQPLELREGRGPQRLEHRFVALTRKNPPLATTPPPKKKHKSYLWAAIGTGVAGLGLIGAGAAFSFLRNSAIKDANKLQSQTPAIQRDYVFFSAYNDKTSTADRNKKLAIAFYTLGGLSLATSVALFIVYAVHKGPPEEQSWRLTPELHPGGVSLGAHFSFD
ncbi:MAG: PEGA domain-containing protein [Myxococcales bacterium]|nr:PEGA domain-containing protein [Myxococcales bacterium]